MKHILKYDNFLNEMGSAPPDRSNPAVANIMSPKGLEDYKENLLKSRTFTKDQLKSIARSSINFMSKQTGMNFDTVLKETEKQIDMGRLLTFDQVSEYSFELIRKYLG